MEDFNSKYTGEEVEQLLDQVASGNAGGGGGGITVETDPIFSGSPAADITEEKMAEWDNKYAKPSGGIPQSDLAEEVKRALRKAEQYTGTVTEIKVNGNNIGASGGVVDLGNLVAVDTVGDLKIIAIQGFINNNLYALPNAANGDEDDILLSRDTVKTINGESIFGSGNITIEGGGSGGEVYITPFTVEQFCTGNVTLTDEQRNELLNAASQNKIIGIPYYIDRNVIETGYIIANYYYSLDDLSTPYIWSLRLGIVFEGAHYNNFISSHSNPNNFFATRAVITPFKPLMHTVTAEDGVAIIEDDAVFTDNRIFFVGGECTELYIYVEPSEIGKTVRFFTGESCTLEFVYPVYWANGEIPTIEPYTHYELSLVQNMEYAYNAVLTPFKPVE